MEEVQLLWRSMEAVQCCPIHQTYDWCRSWVAANGAELAIAVGRIDGEAAFILPLEVVRRHGVRVARYIATPFSNINNGIFAEAGRTFFAEPQSAAAFARQMRQQAPGIDCIVLDKLPFEWRGLRHPVRPDCRMCRTRTRPSRSRSAAASRNCLPAPTASASARSTAHRRDGSMRPAAGSTSSAETPEEALALLEVFFEQKGERLRAQGLPDVFAAERPAPSSAVLRGRCRGATGSCCSSTPSASAVRDGRLCAIAGLSRKGDHLICQLASDRRQALSGGFAGRASVSSDDREGLRGRRRRLRFRRRRPALQAVVVRRRDPPLRRRPAADRPRAALCGRLPDTVAAKRFVKHNPHVLRLASSIRATAAESGPAAD